MNGQGITDIGDPVPENGIGEDVRPLLSLLHQAQPSEVLGVAIGQGGCGQRGHQVTESQRGDGRLAADNIGIEGMALGQTVHSGQGAVRSLDPQFGPHLRGQLRAVVGIEGLEEPFVETSHERPFAEDVAQKPHSGPRHRPAHVVTALH